MNLDTIRDYCLSLPHTTEGFPFGDSPLVFKVKGKLFALVSLDNNCNLNLKCDPNQAVLLRERYDAVQPGYHMNKQHWNTIINDGSIPDKIILGWIKDSFDLVVASLPKKDRF